MVHLLQDQAKMFLVKHNQIRLEISLVESLDSSPFTRGEMEKR